MLRGCTFMVATPEAEENWILLLRAPEVKEPTAEVIVVLRAPRRVVTE
jgi:hypothetical protein